MKMLSKSLLHLMALHANIPLHLSNGSFRMQMQFNIVIYVLL